MFFFFFFSILNALVQGNFFPLLSGTNGPLKSGLATFKHHTSYCTQWPTYYSDGTFLCFRVSSLSFLFSSTRNKVAGIFKFASIYWNVLLSRWKACWSFRYFILFDYIRFYLQLIPIKIEGALFITYPTLNVCQYCEKEWVFLYISYNIRLREVYNLCVYVHIYLNLFLRR